MGQAVLRAILQLVQPPAGLGDADDRHVQALVAHQTQQRGEDLLVGEISGRAKKKLERPTALASIRLLRLFDVSAEFETQRGGQNGRHNRPRRAN